MHKIYEVIGQAMASAKSLEDLRKNFHAAMAAFDLDQYTYQVVQHSALHNMQNFFVTTYPKEWEKHYIEQNYFETDPLVNKFQTNSSSFLWGTESFNESPFSARKMIKEASDFNLQHGIGIPIPGPNKSFSILTLCSKNLSSKELHDVYKNFYKDLMICGLMFHSSFLSLNLDDQLHYTYELTNKEIESLKWICSGKSNNDIAEIVGVTVDAIKDRNSRIFKKLKVSNRLEASMVAKRYKIIEE